MLIVTHSRAPIALPLSRITSARAIEDGDWLVTDAQGEEHRVDKIAWDIAVEGTPSAMVPALPGTYIVNPREEDDSGEKVWKNNVVGWMVCADTETRPVVISPDILIGDKWHVLHPDGRVECSNGDSWESVDQWVAASTPELITA
jgi:hypothetical protein